MPRRIRVTIVEMAHHFLYLPVHYALEANCFGCVPDRYELSLIPAPLKTDRATYLQLIRGARAGHDYVGFAVMDPAELLHDADRHTHLTPPVVLASLITNSSFWAVDRRTHEIRFLHDLASFDKIIAFGEGTTSHGIATRIYKGANKTPCIKAVEPGKELTLLTSSAKGTLALTPDLLGIDKLMADQADTYNVDLALGTTPEYNNVLVTALLSRTDVLQDHPELVTGLLTAIQRAMLLVRFADPQVIKHAMDSHGENETRVTSALRRAADAQVFPATIEVSRAHWLNAARAAADAAGRPYDKGEYDRAGDVFRSAVEPYQDLARGAIRADILPRLHVSRSEEDPEPRNRFRWIEPASLGVSGGTAVGALVAAWLRWPILALALAVVALGGWLTVRLPMNSWVRAIHIVWLCGALGVGVWWSLDAPGETVLAVILPLWLGVEATIILAVAPLIRKHSVQR